jgi:hypothetical protein
VGLQWDPTNGGVVAVGARYFLPIAVRANADLTLKDLVAEGFEERFAALKVCFELLPRHGMPAVLEWTSILF